MGKILTFIFSLLVLFFLGYVAWISTSFFITKLLAAEPTISASIVGAMATILGGLAVVLINNKQAKLRDIAEAHRTKKVAIYEGYLEIIIALTVGNKDDVSIQPPSEQELKDYLVKFKREVLLWGSPEVIKKQLEFENITEKGDTANILKSVNALYKAIRNDIGLSNSGLNDYELVKFFISDRSEVDKIL